LLDATGAGAFFESALDTGRDAVFVVAAGFFSGAEAGAEVPDFFAGAAAFAPNVLDEGVAVALAAGLAGFDLGINKGSPSPFEGTAEKKRGWT